MTHALAIAGAEAAARHADEVTPSWSDRAYEEARKHRKSSFYGDRRFMAEDIRAFAEANGLPKPPDSRAWGSVILRLRREGLCVHSGEYAPMKSPNCHGNPKSVWLWL